MQTPSITELHTFRTAQPADPDTFADEVEYRKIITRPSATSRGFQEIGYGRKRSIGSTS
jgi:hypothetical protein